MTKSKKSGNIREAGVHMQRDGWSSEARSGEDLSNCSSASNASSDGEASKRSPETTLQRSLFIMCLLSQFSILKVRNDFMSGKLDLDEDVTLEEIDLLCMKVLPHWISLKSLKNGLLFARCNILRLVTGEDSLMILSDGFCARSCGDWMKILYEIGTCDYWNSEENESILMINGHSQQFTSPRKCSVGTNTIGEILHSDVTTTVHEEAHSPFRSSNTDSNNGSESVSGTFSGREYIAQGIVPDDLLTADVSIRVVQQHSPLNCEDVSDPFSATQCTAKERNLLNSPSVALFDPVIESSGAQNIYPILRLCRYCRRVGHIESSCWRKLKLCLICGGHHHLRSCSRFREPIISNCIKCPLCRLGHLGKHCPKRKFYETSTCNWCGKNGHSSEYCWMMKGYCLVCGDQNHLVATCPNSRRDHPILIPPWCTDYGDPHLPATGNFPYMK